VITRTPGFSARCTPPQGEKSPGTANERAFGVMPTLMPTRPV
jgi:hypothetical protein